MSEQVQWYDAAPESIRQAKFFDYYAGMRYSS